MIISLILLVKYPYPWPSSRLNSRQKEGDTESFYLDDNHGSRQQKYNDLNQKGYLLYLFDKYPGLKEVADTYRSNYPVTLNKRMSDNYMMNHLVRFINKAKRIRNDLKYFKT